MGKNGKVAPFAPFPKERYIASWQEVAKAMVKSYNLHEGLWQIGLAFERTGANLNTPQHGLVPGIIGMAMELHLKRVEKLDGLSVDAAQVNPEHRIVMPAGVTLPGRN